MTGGNMKTELLSSTAIKIEGRQGHSGQVQGGRRSRVMARSSVDVDAELAQAVQDSVKCRQQDSTGSHAAHSSHSAMGSVDGLKDDSLEARHLKDLLLLHLDLIQQQQELLLAKDRQIQTLRAEKDTMASASESLVTSTFEKHMEDVLKAYEPGLKLKPKQEEFFRKLWEGSRDIIVSLPTGYGKSLLYHLMPKLLALKRNVNHGTVIVICPLNIIQKDQLERLRCKGLSACRLDVMGGGHQCTSSSDSDSEYETSLQLKGDISMSDIMSGQFDLIFAHPEAFETPKGKLLLDNTAFCQTILGVAFDEAHVVTQWGKKFRKSFSRVSSLATYFPTASIVALSGTLTVEEKKTLPSALGMQHPELIEENPDRPNIFLEKRLKPTIRDSISCYEIIYQEECQRLKHEKNNYPVTLFYLPLHICGEASDYCFELFQEEGPVDINNCLFGVLFSNQDPAVIDTITKSLKEQNPRIRLVFCSASVGMGFDSPCITRIIHGVPPRNLSAYFQQIGRAGRAGQPSTALLHYNNNDIATNLPDINPDIIQYCKNNSTCLRLLILQTFGFSIPVQPIVKCKCCSFCANTCECELCKK